MGVWGEGVNGRNGEEIVFLRRGKKVGGGERRRGQVATKTKLGR
jgi:hypothetical protein